MVEAWLAGLQRANTSCHGARFSGGVGVDLSSRCVEPHSVAVEHGTRVFPIPVIYRGVHVPGLVVSPI